MTAVVLELQKVTVPDHESRERDVVLVRRTIYLGKPQGVGNSEWGGGGQFTSNQEPTWTGSHHAKGGIPSK
jgi:hypothetical protein